MIVIIMIFMIITAARSFGHPDRHCHDYHDYHDYHDGDHHGFHCYVHHADADAEVQRCRQIFSSP